MPAPRNGRATEERMFSAIVDAILDQRLAPGTKLKERELGEIFGASRASVRTVLGRLGHSLLVELRPNRGAIIANPSVQETRDLLEARRMLESALVQRLARTLGAKDIAALRRFVAEEKRAYDRGNLKKGKRLSIRFHKLLSEAAGNATLDRFMEHLICRTPLLGNGGNGSSHAYCGADEHGEIVEAIARRDGAGAARRMSEHLSHLEQALLHEDTPSVKSVGEALRAEVN
jgi:DNA-binding GntR family transcriptional regulator